MMLSSAPLTVTQDPAKSQDAALLAQTSEACKRLRQEVGRVIIGQDAVVDHLIIALLTQGHALLHDPAARAIQERFVGYAARDLKKLRTVLPLRLTPTIEPWRRRIRREAWKCGTWACTNVLYAGPVRAPNPRP